jgi:hypothetical protein
LPQAATQAPVDYAGLAGRVAIKGGVGAALGFPALIADAGRGVINTMYAGQNYLADKANSALGTNIPMASYLPSALHAVDQGSTGLADYLGAAKPQTPKQQAAVDVGSAAISALGPGGFGRLLSRAAPTGTTLATTGERLAATPVLDAVSGATSEAAAKSIEAKGGGAGQQFVGGTVAGIGVPWAAALLGRRAVTPFTSQLTNEQARLAQVLADEGVPLSAGQRTGRPNLQYTEDQISKLPLNVVDNPRAGQPQAYTQAVLRHAGVNAEAATPEILANAHNRIGNEIGSIVAPHTISFDQQFGRDIQRTVAEYRQNLPPDRAPIFDNYLAELASPTASLPGTTYQKTRSNMTAIINDYNNSSGSDRQLQRALIGLRTALDDAAERSMTRAGAADDVAALNQARQNYANLQVIQDAVARSGQAGATGQINASALAAASKASVGRRQYTRGVGDLNDLAHAGDAFLRPLPDSTTARREAIPKLATAVAGAWTLGGPAAAGAVLAAPSAMGMAVNSRLMQAYLGNQLLPGRQQIPLGAIPGLLGQ